MIYVSFKYETYKEGKYDIETYINTLHFTFEEKEGSTYNENFYEGLRKAEALGYHYCQTMEDSYTCHTEKYMEKEPKWVKDLYKPYTELINYNNN